jgi:molybdopterin-guanine dinucleotide biosynthesis protein A
VSDLRQNCGPLAGLEAALLASGSLPLLVLSIDTPGISVELLRRLLGMASPQRGVVPRLKIYFEEVVVGDPFIGNVAVYPSAILPHVQRALDSEDRSFQTMIRRAIPDLLTTWDVPRAQEPQFQNVNTLKDYEAFLGRLNKRMDGE